MFIITLNWRTDGSHSQNAITENYINSFTYKLRNITITINMNTNKGNSDNVHVPTCAMCSKWDWANVCNVAQPKELTYVMGRAYKMTPM